jgi:hypothetical protein
MDKVSDFFKELKERVSNPLILSFIISWLIWNWKIPIALLFYKPIDLRADHYDSFIDLIKKNNVNGYHFWCAVLFAICYTLLYPIVKQGVLIVGTFFDKHGTSYSLKYVKSAVVPFIDIIKERDEKQKLYDQVTTYTADKQKLIDDLANMQILNGQIIKNANEDIANTKISADQTISENNKRITAILEQKTLIEEKLYQLEQDVLNQKNSISYLVGTWDKIVIGKDTEVVEITDNFVFYVDQPSDDPSVDILLNRRHFRISSITYNDDEIVLTMYLSFRMTVDSDNQFFWRLTKGDNKSNVSGITNFGEQFTLTRPS